MQIKRFEFNPISENTYLIYDETKEAAIIDCGVFSLKEKAELNQFIENNQLKIKCVLNTHLHMDHAFGNPFAHKTYGILPSYHPAEEALPDIIKQSRLFGIDFNEENPVGAHHLNEGDIVSVGNIRLKAILVPGHSPGSLCFYAENETCVFVGDVIFRGSIGRTDLWGGNYQLLVSGIKEKLLTLPDNTDVYPGHGPVTTIRYEKQSNSFLKNI